MKKPVSVLIVVLIGAVLAGCGTAGQYAGIGSLIGGGLGAGAGALLDGARGAKIGAVAGAGVGGYLGYGLGLGREREEAALAYQQALANGVSNCQRHERYVGGKLVVDSLNCDSYTQRPGFRGDPLPAGPAVPQVIYEPAAVRQDPYSQAVPTVPSAAATIPTVPPSATMPPPAVGQPFYGPPPGPYGVQPQQYGSWWQKHHRGGFRSWGRM